MDAILNKKDKPTVDKMKEFMKTLTPEQQRQVDILIKGIQLGIAFKEEQKSA